MVVLLKTPLPQVFWQCEKAVMLGKQQKIQAIVHIEEKLDTNYSNEIIHIYIYIYRERERERE